MAYLYKSAAAVCLVAACGLQSFAAATSTYKFTGVDVGKEAYFAVSLARNGQLPFHISDVTETDSIVTALKQKVEATDALTGTTTCDTLTLNDNLKTMFHQNFEFPESTTPDYLDLLQTALTTGIEAFPSKQYPTGSDGWKAVWGNPAGFNLAYLLGSTSTKIGCVIGRCTEVKPAVVAGGVPGADGGSGTQNVLSTKAVLFCQLDPAATTNEAPFTEEYFKGLVERTTPLNQMSEQDLQSSATGDAAAVAVPTFLIAGLVAMLTAASA